jgi:phospholipase C
MKKLFLLFLCTQLFGQTTTGARIDHIFVIFNENRSFDHLFATYQNANASSSGFGAKPIGQCSATAPSNAFFGCYVETDCGGTNGSTNYCSRGSALEYPTFVAKTSTGATVSVMHNPSAGNDLNCFHVYSNTITDVDSGLMDKFDTGCAVAIGQTVSNAFVYYNHTDYCSYAGGTLASGVCSLPTLWNIAESGVVMDHFFASQIGPSYPARLYLIAGTSAESADIPPNTSSWSCNYAMTTASPVPTSTTPGWYQQSVGSVTLSAEYGLANNTYYHGGQCTTGPNINSACICAETANNATCTTDTTDCGSGNTCTVALNNAASGCVGGTKGCICPNVTTVGDLADTAGVTWHWWGPLANGNGFEWNAFSYIQHIYFGADWATNVSAPGSTSSTVDKLITAINNCTTVPTCTSLTQLNWVQTGEPQNGHPQNNASTNYIQSNQSWTTSVVSAIQNNPTVYQHSLIIILWDDFGGFYDHIPTFTGPTQLDNLGWGPRIAAMAIGPFVQGGVSHTPFEFSSVLQCMESPPYLPVGPFTLTQVNGSGGYVGTITGGASNAYAGVLFTITGFSNGANNLTKAMATASTATTLTFSATTSPCISGCGTDTATSVAPWSLGNLGKRDINAAVNNLCTAPGTVTNAEWTTGGIVNMNLNAPAPVPTYFGTSPTPGVTFTPGTAVQ